MPITSNPRQNLILAALPSADYERLLPELEPVALPLGMVLHEAGGAYDYVYFPTDGIVSLLIVTQEGESTEVAVTGNEGLVGISLLLSGDTTPRHAVVQIAGSGYRLKADIVKNNIDNSGALHYLALRYTQALITQMGQVAVCNRHHQLRQQLCRWLLLSLDRLPSNEVNMTQELIANNLGVRREGVSEAAKSLQSRGVIKYRRGHINVLDRAKLEACVCECYPVVKREYDRLLKHAAPRTCQQTSTMPVTRQGSIQPHMHWILN